MTLSMVLQVLCSDSRRGQAYDVTNGFCVTIVMQVMLPVLYTNQTKTHKCGVTCGVACVVADVH